MPFVCGRIVIDFHWRRKGHTAIRAAREHHVCAVAVAGWTNTAHHVNIVVRKSTRAIHCQKDLPCQPSRIYIPAGSHPTEVDLSDLFEDWGLSTNLRISGTNAPKLRSNQVLSTNEQSAISIHIRRSMYDTMGDIDRALPAHAAICGTAKFAGRARKVGRPKLVLKSVTRAGGLIDRKPLLISSTCSWKTRPRLAAVSRLPIVVAKVVPQKGIIEKRPYLVCTQNRIAAENARLQHPGKRPVNPTVRGITPAALPEAGAHRIELPPTDRHFVAVSRIDRYRGFVCRVANDVVALRINIRLIACEQTKLRDHSRRFFQPENVRWRHIVRFLVLLWVHWLRLCGTGSNRCERDEQNREDVRYRGEFHRMEKW